MYLAKMTWEEVRSYLQNNDALLIPIGTCEQHGYHCPLGTDTFIVNRICEILSAKYNILIAPAINYGIHFDVDNNYPGVGALKADTVRSIFNDLRENWLIQGFKKLIIVSFHGVPEHFQVLENLGDNFYLIKASVGDISDLLEKQENLIHGCEGETSVMLHTHPDLVRMERAVDADDLDDFREHLLKQKRFDIDTYPGNLGFSTFATKEKGELITKRLLGYIEKKMDEILKG